MALDSTLGVAVQPSPIAAQASACLRRFERLSDLFARRDVPIHGITRMQVLDLHGQLRVWASNIGALQPRHMASSLDYRLRDAPKFAAVVVSLLEDLAETLEDVYAIASGERENRSGTPILSLLEKLDEDCSDSPRVGDSGQASSIEVAEHNEEIQKELKQISEIQELFKSIPETISRLFKLSILIRNSSSRDRYAKALTVGSKAPVNPSYDIDYVQNKFPHLRQKEMEWLRIRLGKAITQRRQYLWYCRDHREKMAKATETGAETQATTALLNVDSKQPLQATDDTKSQVSKQLSNLSPTTASTVIPTRLQSPDILERLDEELNDADNRSVTSYASSVGENEEENRLSVIQLEEISTPNVPFECPYCWTIQKFSGQHAWKKHVMADLKAYVCTAEACDMKLFTDAHTWSAHELQNHLVEWHCCFCSRTPFATLDKFQSHVVKSHGIKLGEHQLASLSKTCQKPIDQLEPSACRICGTWERTLRALNKHIPDGETLVVTPQQFHHHVRGHMEQLALFAIPRAYREDEDEESGKEIGEPTTADDFRREIDQYVKDSDLGQFCALGNDYLNKVAEKAIELKDDPRNYLKKPEQIKGLVRLALYQPVFYCDDSSSMNIQDSDSYMIVTRMDVMRILVQRMASIATRLVPDGRGAHVRFINSNTTGQDLNADQIDQLLQFHPNGKTDIGTNLTNKILEPMIYADLDKPGGALERPFLVLTITDGEPNPEPKDTFKKAIENCGRRLEEKQYPQESVMFLISQIGDSFEAEAFLDSLSGDPAIDRVLYWTSERLGERFADLRDNEEGLEEWLFNILMQPITG